MFFIFSDIGYYIKIIYRYICVLIFKVTKKIILKWKKKDIEEILKQDDWETTRSILFFYTNILIKKDEVDKRSFPVKKFKIKWYIWVIHYIFAFWVLSKIFLYLFSIFMFEVLYFRMWEFIWLVILEWWRWRLYIYIWILHIISFVLETINLLLSHRRIRKQFIARNLKRYKLNIIFNAKLRKKLIKYYIIIYNKICKFSISSKVTCSIY